MKNAILLLLLFLTMATSAVELDGKTVILLVSEHRQGDAKMESVKEKLLAKRESLGMDTEDMPIVFMGFKDSDTERKYFDQLGFQEFDAPVLCVVEWGAPARFGPKRVLDYAIYRTATPQHVDFIVKNFLTMKGQDPDSLNQAPELPLDASGELELLNIKFAASGAPVYLTNAGVRLRNTSHETIRDIKVRFYIKLEPESEWQLLGQGTIPKLLTANFASKELVEDTRKTVLLNEHERARSCLYRVEVEYDDKLLFREGVYQGADH